MLSTVPTFFGLLFKLRDTGLGRCAPLAHALAAPLGG